MAGVKKLEYSIEISPDITVKIGDKKNAIKMIKGNKEQKRIFHDNIIFELDNNKLKVSIKGAKKDQRRIFGSVKSHIRNMLEGLGKDFEYELEVCNAHFPINVSFDKTKSEFMIKNFLGEKFPRILKTKGAIEVEVKMPVIKIRAHDIELAGQVAADLEKVTKIRNRDRNKFQDGIFITKKPGRTEI